MITKFVYQRTIIIALLFALLFSTGSTSCNARKEISPAYVAAQTLLANAPRVADGDAWGTQVGMNMRAVSMALEQTPGSAVLYNAANAGRDAVSVYLVPASNGVNYYMGIIRNGRLVDICAQFDDCGSIMNARNMEEILVILRSKGYEEVSPTSIPMITYSVKLAIDWLKSRWANFADWMTTPIKGGGETSFIVIPFDIIDPSSVPAWCNNCMEPIKE